MKELIQKLVESVGPSGYEDGVRNLIKQEVSGLGRRNESGCAGQPDCPQGQ